MQGKETSVILGEKFWKTKTAASLAAKGGVQNLMGYVISVTNQKGGVGKTLTATSLASILTTKGYKVLSIDMDPQCNFDQVAGGPGPIKQYDLKSLSILDVLRQECSIEDAIVQTNIGDLVRATPNLSQWTGRSLLSRHDFKKLMDQGASDEDIVALLKDRYQTGWGATEHKTLDWMLRDVRGKYDFIFLDTNPSLTLLTLNSLYTADYIIIPAFTEETSRKAIIELKDTIDQLQIENADMHAEILGILITKFKRRTNIATAYLLQYRKLASKIGTSLFDTKIREGLPAIEYSNHKKDLIRYAPKHQMTQDYQDFANEFLQRIHEKEMISHG